MSNFLTMVAVLGGTFVAGAALLYLSLMTGRRQPQRQTRDEALETTAVMAAAQDTNAGGGAIEPTTPNRKKVG